MQQKTYIICYRKNFVLENAVCPSSFCVRDTWLYLQTQCICTAEILVSLCVYTCASALLTYVFMSHWLPRHSAGKQAGLPGNALPSHPCLRLAPSLQPLQSQH